MFNQPIFNTHYQPFSNNWLLAAALEN